jgi:hypothetical protein
LPGGRSATLTLGGWLTVPEGHRFGGRLPEQPAELRDRDALTLMRLQVLLDLEATQALRQVSWVTCVLLCSATRRPAPASAEPGGRLEAD